ncbi:ParB N-terminal domain-containing protein [Streptomyces sp. NPDC001251]
MTAKTTTTTVWPTLPVAQLADQAAAVPADAALTESVAADGLTDPLYVATTATGTVRVVDGLRRLAAAVAAGLTEVPVTYRPLIRLDALTAHPGNVRTNLRITKTFRASVRALGVRIPLSVTPTPEGLRVVDGHRRLAAAVAEGLTHVPYELDERDEAGQMLDMVTTATHREGLTVVEEASALFAASELGAGIRSLAAASGRTQADVKTAVRVARSTAAAAAAATRTAQAPTVPLTLDQLAQIAALEEQDPAAAQRVADQIATTPTNPTHLEWMIGRELTALKAAAELAARRAELEAEGARIRTLEELSEKAAPVYRLRDVATVTDHAACQGDAWVMTDDTYVRYCTNAQLFGHTMPATASSIKERDRAVRRARIAGGRDWDTATTLRQQWLTAQISPKSLPRARADQFTAIVTAELLNGGPALCARLSHDKRPALTAEFLGIENADQLTERAAKAPRRAPAFQFATLAAAAELNIPRTAWRTAASYDGDDRYAADAARRRAAAWLTTLTTLGYEPTPIEAAILAGEAYTPDTETPDED